MNSIQRLSNALYNTQVKNLILAYSEKTGQNACA